MSKIKVIYNPKAGKKRQLFDLSKKPTIYDLKKLFAKYQLEADFQSTRYAGQATKIANEAIKRGYEIIVAAGGDGTVSEVANALVNRNATLGILPLGTFMNIARMLGIPLDLEKAVMILKINRVRKIDVGEITEMNGEKITNTFYYLENAGFGLEAEVYYWSLEAEAGHLSSLWDMANGIISYEPTKVSVEIDGRKIATEPTMVSISNGPYTGAAFYWSPTAKLNDHRLTVRVFTMTKDELIRYVIALRNNLKHSTKGTKNTKHMR